MGTIRSNRNPGVITQLEHSNSARVARATHCGFVNGTLNNTVAAEVLIGANKHILASNRNAAVQYIAFGGSTIVVTNGTNGVPILPGQTLRLCSGTAEYVKATHADVHVTEIFN